VYTHYDTKNLMRRAYEKALESPDPSTQNSALLVTDMGSLAWIVAEDVNRFPDGVEYTPERWERPLKYSYVEHAERNVIYQLARKGYPTEGLIMISCWACCSDCARAIIQAGIKKLVTHKQAVDRSPPFWAEEVKVAYTMLQEAGVELEFLDATFGGIEIRHTGEVWRP
jgi:dCMP deaminase